MARFVYTRANRTDAAELATTAAEGFETYREFAPPGWEPPPEGTFVKWARGSLGKADTWTLLARTADGNPAGHVAFCSAFSTAWPDPLDGLAHLWQLFVREPFWGTGVATTLHARAIAEAGRQGYTAMRLYTPEGQARARRFYEREGWAVWGAPVRETGIGIPLVQYRRPLG